MLHLTYVRVATDTVSRHILIDVDGFFFCSSTTFKASQFLKLIQSVLVNRTRTVVRGEPCRESTGELVTKVSFRYVGTTVLYVVFQMFKIGNLKYPFPSEFLAGLFKYIPTFISCIFSAYLNSQFLTVIPISLFSQLVLSAFQVTILLQRRLTLCPPGFFQHAFHRYLLAQVKLYFQVPFQF